MITPMKKVTVLTIASSVDATLDALRSLEILHITPLQSPTGAALNHARSEVNRVQKALDSVPDKVAKNVKQAENLPTAKSLVDEIQQLIAKSKQAELDKEQSEDELSKLHMFKNLDPATVNALEAKGIFVRLYQISEKESFEIDGEGSIENFGSDENGSYVAVISKGLAPVNVKGHFIELQVPSKSLAELRKLGEDAKATIANVEARLNELSAAKSAISGHLAEVTDDYNKVEAAAQMAYDKNVAALQGFCPAPRIKDLENAARQNGWGLLIDDPTDDDNVPTLIGYNKLTAPMQFLYNIIGISPGYKEVDVSSVFLCFFSIFFAMIVGDTAYGLLFLGIALFMRKKMPKANPAAFSFIYLMSAATIIWGIINASFLGLTPDIASWTYYLDITNYGFLPEPVRNAMLWIRTSAPTDPAKFEAYKSFAQSFTSLPQSFVPTAMGASQMQHIQLFCFCIAAVHLSIAYVWNVLVRIKAKDSTFMAQIGWLLCCWVMFGLACNMVLGIDMPKFAIPMFIVAAILLVLFSVPPKRLKQDWISIPMLVLNIVNSFTDVISYIRLFAVGMSGAAIAEAFNGMLSPLFGSAVGIAGAAILLLLVHALNIALAVMGVAVHAVRLNTLEFSNGLGMEWSGYAFTPFAKQKN